VRRYLLPKAVWELLTADQELSALLGKDDTYGPWIFRWRPRVTLEGSGASLIVIRVSGQWMVANRHNTAEFPRLQLEFRSDVPRTSDGAPEGDTPEESVIQAFEVANKLLHRPSGEIRWGTLRVVSSTLFREPIPVTGVEANTAHGVAEWDIVL
jgi:hypothetical protein